MVIGQSLRMVTGQGPRMVTGQSLRMVTGQGPRMVTGQSLRMVTGQSLRMVTGQGPRMVTGQSLRMVTGGGQGPEDGDRPGSEDGDRPGSEDGEKSEQEVGGIKKIILMQSGSTNKPHVCIFCEKMVKNIARHLEQTHQNEPEVVKILLIRKRSKERRKAWECLVNKGDFHHNYQVFEKGNGMLIPKYRKKTPTTEGNGVNYIPCEFCQGLFVKTDLWKHQKSCQENSAPHPRGKPVSRGRLLLPVNSSYGDLHKLIISRMNDDAVKSAIVGDMRIMTYGRRLVDKYGSVQKNYITQKLRQMGRLLVQLKSHSIYGIDDALDRSSWDVLVEAVKGVSGYDKETQQYGTPSLALKLGHSLKACATYLQIEALKDGDDEKKRKAEAFLQLYKADWEESVSSKALNTLQNKQYNRPNFLPLVQDVVKLYNFLEEKAKELCEKIDQENGRNIYLELAKVCLTLVILFNRKRAGEAERITMQGFLAAQLGKASDPVVLSTLTKFEQRLCQTHTHIDIRGKRNRKVAVILTPKLRKYIKVLLKHRKIADIKTDYIFGRPGSAQYPYRGCDCLRAFVKQCGATYPALMTSTRLRKQMATLIQILSLSDNSQDLVATFQGHDIRVHRAFYRLPESTLQVAKVAKVLHCINNGTIAQYKGKDFDEIEFDLEGAYNC